MLSQRLAVIGHHNLVTRTGTIGASTRLIANMTISTVSATNARRGISAILLIAHPGTGREVLPVCGVKFASQACGED